MHWRTSLYTLVPQLTASRQTARTAVAAHHDPYRRQMVVICGRANVGECSRGFQPNTTVHSRDHDWWRQCLTSQRITRTRSSLGANKDTTEGKMFSRCVEEVNWTLRVRRDSAWHCRKTCSRPAVWSPFSPFHRPAAVTDTFGWCSFSLKHIQHFSFFGQEKKNNVGINLLFSFLSAQIWIWKVCRAKIMFVCSLMM